MHLTTGIRIASWSIHSCVKIVWKVTILHVVNDKSHLFQQNIFDEHRWSLSDVLSVFVTLQFILQYFQYGNITSTSYIEQSSDVQYP